MGDTCDIIVAGSEIRRTGAGVATQINHSHPELELSLVIAGKGTFFLENDQYDLVPGTLVWLLPNLSHRLIRSPELDMWVITYSAERCASDLLDTVTRHPARVLARDDAIAFDRLLAHVAQDSDEPRLYRAGLDYVIRSAQHLSETSAEPAQTPLHPAVLIALKQLRLRSDLANLGALAKKCGVSQDYLGQLLIEQTGRSFVEWRNRTRLERFHVVYPESGDLLTAALAANFGSYNQFHRVFVDLVGSTPGQWAKGGHPNGIHLPSIQAMPESVERGSARTIWYRLADLVLTDAERWLGKEFGDHYLAANSLEEVPVVESGILGVGDLRRFEKIFVEEADLAHPETARILERAFGNNDVFANMGNVVQQCHYSIGDMAGIVGSYFAIAWMAANLSPTPSYDWFANLRVVIQASLSASNSFAAATLVERRKAAAAILAQTYFIRSALIAAGASGSDAMLGRVSDAAQANALRTLGINFRELKDPLQL